MEKLDRIVEVLENMQNDEIVDIWNRYCEDCNYYDDRIEYMSDLDELVCAMKPMDIINTFCDSAFNVNDDYFWFNGCGNPVSSDNPFDQVSVYDLSRYIVSYEEDFGYPEIAEILEDSDGGEES